MPIIDNNIVSMSFDNSKFEKNVQQSLLSISRLKEALTFDGLKTGLNALGQATETVKVKISAMQIAAVAALTRITNSAITAGKNMVKSLSIDQVTAGWDKYAEKTTGVQTIMAATGKSIDEVNDSLDKLNWFTDETSYRFTDMITNIGKFTSQGIELDTAVSAMEGISTWASVSGQGVNEASRAMYNLAQAIGVGSVKLMDWKSIENANMATREFKQQAIDAALAVGTLTKKVDENGEETLYAIDKTTGKMSKTQVTLENFSQTLSEGWFTSDVLLDVLNDYGAYADKLYELQDYVADGVSKTTSQMIEDVDSITDATTDAEIIQMGYTKDAIGLLREMANMESVVAKKSFKAAQEAKTFGEAIDSVREAVASGWMQTFENIFGNYEEAKKLWTDLANDLYDTFAESGNERNEILAEWKELVEGGRDDLITSFKSIFGYVTGLWNTIKDVFHEIFPKKTAEDLGNMVKRFKEWTDNLGKNNKNLEKFKTGLRGIFITFKTMSGIVTQVSSAFKKVFGDIFAKTGSFALNLFEKIGKALGTINKYANRTVVEVKGKAIYKIAESFANVLKNILLKLKEVYNVGKKAFSALLGNNVIGNIQKMVKSGSLFDKIVSNIVKGLDFLSSKIASLNIEKHSEKIESVFGRINTIFKTITSYAKAFFRALTGKDYSEVFSEGWEKSTNVLDKFAKRIILLADVFNYYYEYISQAEHKGAAFIDSLKGIFQSLVWVITGSMGDATRSVSDFVSTLSEKIDTKMFKWFGDYWISFKNVVSKVMAVIDRITSSIKNLSKAFKMAFRSVFPMNDSLSNFSKILLTIKDKITAFIKSLEITKKDTKDLFVVFKGLFSVVDIVLQLFKAIGKQLSKNSGASGKLIDRLKSIVLYVSNLIYNFDRIIKQNGTMDRFVENTVRVFSELWRIFKQIAGITKELIKGLFGIEDSVSSNDGAETTAKGFSKLADVLGYIADALAKVDFDSAKEKAHSFGEKLRDIFSIVKDKAENGITKFKEFLNFIRTKFKSTLTDDDDSDGTFLDSLAEKIAQFKDKIGPKAITLIEKIMDALKDPKTWETILKVAGLIITGKLVKKITDIGDSVDEVVGKIGDTLSKFGGKEEDKTKAIKAVALSVLALSVALLILAKIDTVKVLEAIAVIAVLLKILQGSFTTLDGIGKAVWAKSLIKIALSMILFAAAMKIIGSMDLASLIKGILGIAIVMRIMTDALLRFTQMKFMDEYKMKKAAGALIETAIAMILFGVAMKIIGSMDVGAIIKSLAVFAAIMAMMLILNKGAEKLPVVASALLIVSVAMVVFSAALAIISKIIEQGNIVGAVLVIAALFASLLILNDGRLRLPIIATALLIVSVALVVFAAALAAISEVVKRGNIAETIIIIAALFVALLILNDGRLRLPIMASALLIVSVALVVFAAALLMISKAVEQGNVLQAIGIIALFLAVLLILNTLSPLLPVAGAGMLLVSAALLVLGVALITIGMALQIFINMIATAPDAIHTLLMGIVNFVALIIPEIISAFAEGFVLLVTTLAENAPTIGEALKVIFTTIFNTILDVLIAVTPKAFELIGLLIQGVLKILTDAIPSFVAFIKVLLIAIQELIPFIVDTLFTVLITIIDVLGRRLPELISAVFQFFSRLIKGFAQALYENAEDIGYSLAYAFGALIAAALKMLKGFITGASDAGLMIKEAAQDLGNALVEKVFGGILKMKDKLSDAAEAVKDKAKDMAEGAKGFFSDAADTLSGWANDGLNAIKGVFGVNSPSKEMRKIGGFLDDGLVLGLNDNQKDVEKETKSLGNSVLEKLTEALSVAQEAADLDLEFTPTITPIIDLSEFEIGIGSMDNMMNGLDSSVNLMGDETSRNLSSISAINAKSRNGQNGEDVNDSDTVSGNVYNFTQNNYSPESLSRTDIYRQTKNLLNNLA